MTTVSISNWQDFEETGILKVRNIDPATGRYGVELSEEGSRLIAEFFGIYGIEITGINLTGRILYDLAAFYLWKKYPNLRVAIEHNYGEVVATDDPEEIQDIDEQTEYRPYMEDWPLWSWYPFPN